VRFAGEIKTVAEVLSQTGLDWRDYLNLATARLTVAHGNYNVGTTLMDILGDRIQDFSVAKILGLTNMENLIIYSNFLDSTLSGAEDMQNLVYGMAELFLGDKAYTKDTIQGSWDKLGGVVFDLAEILNQNNELVEDLTDMFSAGNLDAQAMIGKIGNLIITQEYYDNHRSEFADKTYDQIKYQKVDALLDGVYDAINAFKPVNNFLTSKLKDMNSEGDNELLKTLTDLMSAEREVWYDKFQGLVSAANLMNNESVSDLMDKLGDGEGEITTEDIAKVFDVINEKRDTIICVSALPAYLRWLMYVCFLLLLILLIPKETVSPFIYFQF